MSRVSFLFLAAVLLSCSTLANAAQYHLAKTNAEKALNHALAVVDENANAPNDLWDAANTVSFDYTTILTSRLIQAIQLKERKSVQDQCGGHYLPGEECGLGFNPITCAQDSVSYQYHTQEIAKNHVIIRAIQPKEPKTPVTYRLVYDGGWKLDGITCDPNARFNADNGK